MQKRGSKRKRIPGGIVARSDMLSREHVAKMRKRKLIKPTNYKEFDKYLQQLLDCVENGATELGMLRVISAVREHRHLFKGERKVKEDSGE